MKLKRSLAFFYVPTRLHMDYGPVWRTDSIEYRDNKRVRGELY